MSIQPTLFDRQALARHRERAAQNPVLFLREAIAAEVDERVKEVNRTFTAPAIVTAWPEVWQTLLPRAIMVPDDELLALKPGAHDLVIHDLSLHWANDPVGQIVQCRHALQPDGLFLGTMFGGETLQELRRCLAEAETRTSGGLSPRVAPMGEIRDLGGLLQRAGFALPVADNAQLTVTYENALSLMRDLRGMGENNAMQDRLRRPTSRTLLLEAARLYAETFGTSDGRIPATFDIVTLTGWAPDASQPKPLRPGSASERLADALKTTETKLDSSND